MGDHKMKDLLSGRSLLRVIIAALSITQVFGCAHLQYVSNYDPNQPPKNWYGAELDGIHYYRPAIYLWLTVDPKVTVVGNNASCIPQLQYLPDFHQESVIIPRLGIGSVQFAPTLTDGWNLTALNTTVDSKVPETITAVGSLLSAALTPIGGGAGAAAGGKKELEKGAPTTYLYPGFYRLDLRKFPSSNTSDFLTPVLTTDQLVCAVFAPAQLVQPPAGGSPAGGNGKDNGGAQGGGGH
jgi:hypothetical protein